MSGSEIKQKKSVRYIALSATLIMLLSTATQLIITPRANAAPDCSESAKTIRLELYARNNIGSFSDPCDTEISCSTTGGTTATVLTGGTIEEQVWNFFAEKGLTAEQIAGIMGNISHESNFDPAAIEGSGGGGFGLVQWTGGRRTAIENAAAAAGRDVNDIAFQLEYLMTELQARGPTRSEYLSKGYLSEWDGLTKQTTVNDALIFFHHEFEVSYIVNFDIPGYVAPFHDRTYPNSQEAVIGERGGVETPTGHPGAQYYFETFGDGTSSSGCGVSNGGDFVHPIADGTPVNEGYGGPRSFGSVSCGGIIWHNGYDFDGQQGVTPVLAAHAGTVILTGDTNNTVVVVHADGFRTRYMHMDTGGIVAKDGAVVAAGDQLGTVGDTGFSSGPHLHFEVDVLENKNPEVAKLPLGKCTWGKFVNPAEFMKLFGVDFCPSGGCDNPITN